MKLEEQQEKQTPKQTVHNWCHYCVQSRSDKDVEGCGGYVVYATGRPCPFYEYRMGDKRISVKVFRQFCLECMGGRKDFVSECDTISCPMHPYRMAKNPALRGQVRGASLISKCAKDGAGGANKRPESIFQSSL